HLSQDLGVEEARLRVAPQRLEVGAAEDERRVGRRDERGVVARLTVDRFFAESELRSMLHRGTPPTLDRNPRATRRKDGACAASGYSAQVTLTPPSPTM